MHLDDSSFDPLCHKWFATNKAAAKYEECLEATPENKTLLSSLLKERSVEAVKRLKLLEEEKESLGKLYKSGSISESMWNSLKNAEKETQLEIYDIQAEAEAFKKGTPIVFCFFQPLKCVCN